jgi:hypothetical protein
VLLAAIALLAQIASPMLHSPVLRVSEHSFADVSAAVDPLALCLAPGGGVPDPAAPADRAPDPDHGCAACCFWHGSVGAVCNPTVPGEPIAFAQIRVAFTAPPADVPIRRSSVVRARAPPPRV